MNEAPPVNLTVFPSTFRCYFTRTDQRANRRPADDWTTRSPLLPADAVAYGRTKRAIGRWLRKKLLRKGDGRQLLVMEEPSFELRRDASTRSTELHVWADYALADAAPQLAGRYMVTNHWPVTLPVLSA